MSVRLASHAGTWYSDDETKLAHLIDTNLNKAQKVVENVKAIIVPHAGYEYSAETAAWAWKNVDPKKVKRVFILGPSHHKYMERCAIPSPSIFRYNTPFGDVELDEAVLTEMRNANIFDVLNIDEDTKEHSIELVLPFLKKILENQNFSIIPVVVGALHSSNEVIYANFFFRYFADYDSLFVISSDFCHWGKRFRYTYVKPGSQGISINDTIQQLDLLGAELIERQNYAAFHAYLRIHGNTICGRHPIGILLHMIETALKYKPASLKTRKLHYSQSSSIKTLEDSCVSYCSLITELL